MALNFLVTGVKMLKKSLDKKKMKEGAKKFVGGEKEEKRAKISKIMDRESSYGGKTKAKKPASISKSKLMKVDIDKVAKVTPDSAKIDYKAFTAKVDNIVGMTDALAFLTGAQSEQKKDELKLLRQQKEAEKKRKKEAKLEKKDNMLGKIGKGIKKAAQSPLDAITNFFVKMAIGALVVFLISNADKIKKIFQTIGENLEGFSKLLRVTIFAFANGMKLARAGLGLIGKGVGKLFSPIQKMISAMGSKIGGVFGSLGQRLLKIVKNLPGIKQIGQMVNNARRVGDTARAGLTAKKELIKQTVTKGFNKVTGNVLRRGLTKAPSRLILKLFGKDAAKAVAKSGKLFKVLGKAAKGIKVPVLGPIIVAVTSILSGDPLGKTLFRTLGAVFGGMIGGAIGAALGGVGAPFGLLLGEIVGEFIGSFLYDMFNGDESGTKGMDFLKKKFGQLLTGAGKAGKAVMNFALSMLTKAGNFFKDGFSRFITNFPTVDIPEGGGRQTVGGKIAKFLGVKEESRYLEDGRLVKVPNLALLTPFGAPFLIPHLKNSFFPSGEKEEVPTSETSTSALEGGDEDATTAVVETPDNSDATIDDSGSGGGTTTAQLAESDTSSASSSVSNVSSQTTYEESAAGTVILQAPQRSDFGAGRSGARQYQQAMIMYNNQKEMLNSYFKTQVKSSLYKI